MKRRQLPTRKRLKELFDYDQRGFFVRRKKVGAQTFIGQKVGGSLHHSGYKHLRIDGQIFLFHRVVFQFHKGETPDVLDHINRKRTDNRIENLRPSNLLHNQRNRNLNKNNSSGVNGVSFDTKSKMWKCRIRINGVRKTYFSSKIKKICCEQCIQIEKGLYVET